MNRKFLVDGLLYSGSRYLVLALGFIRSFVIAGILAPTEYGLWVLFTTILMYTDQFHLGLRHLGDREIPYAREREKPEVLQAFIRELYGGVLLLGLALFMAFLAYALFDERAPSVTRLGFVFAGGIALTDQANRFHFMLQRTKKEFVSTSKIETLFEAFKTLLITYAVLNGRVLGGLAATAATNGVLLLYFWKRDSLLFVLSGPKAVAGLLKASFPLAVSGLLLLTVTLIDRFTGALLFSKEDLGFYGMSALLSSIPLIAAQGVGMVAYPNLNELLGKLSSREEVSAFFLKVHDMVMLTVPVVTMAAVATCPFLLELFLPAYVPGVPTFLILSGGILFFSTSALYVQYFQAKRLNASSIRIQSMGLSITVLLLTISMLVHPTKEFLAGSWSCSAIVASLLLMGGVFSDMKGKSDWTSSVLKYSLFLVLSSAVMAACFTGVRMFIKSVSVFAAFSSVVVMIVAFAVLYGLILAACRKKKMPLLPSFEAILS